MIAALKNSMGSKTAQVLARLKKTIVAESLIKRGDTVYVSISGGKDSVSLFFLLNRLRSELSMNLKALHFNFGLRGAESLRDEKFVSDLADRMGIPLVVKRFDMDKSALKKENKQMWARRMRLDAYEKIKGKKKNVKFALAHTLDDQVETFFIRLFRGSGLKGISGMHPVFKGYLIRPLLAVANDDLKKVIVENGLTYVEDSSNSKSEYFRNWIRNELMPNMARSSTYRDFRSAVSRVMDVAGTDDIYLDKIARKIMKKMMIEQSESSIRYDLRDYLALDRAIRRRVLRIAVNKLAGNLRGISLSHIEEADELISGNSGAKEQVFPGGIRLIKDYKDFQFTRKPSSVLRDFSYVLKIPGSLTIGECGKTVSFEVVKTKDPKRRSMAGYLDLDKFAANVEVRNFRNGDRIVLNEKEGARKIKNLFIAKKISRSERRTIPFIVDRGKVAVIAGVCTDINYRATAGTKRVAKVTISQP